MANEKYTYIDYGTTKKTLFARKKLVILFGLLVLFVFSVFAFHFLSTFSFYGCSEGEEKQELVQEEEETTVLDSVLVFQHKNGYFELKNSKTKAILQGKLGQSLENQAVIKKEIKERSFSVEWGNSVSLDVSKESDRCFSVNWTSKQNNEPRYFLDCFNLGAAHWYGGSELYKQEWPLEKADIKMMPYLPSDTILGIGQGKVVYGTVLERYWFTSTGAAILVNESVPLHVSVNASGDGQLCLKADPQDYPASTLVPLHLSYKVCAGDNVKDIHQFVMKEFFQYPSGIPDERMMKQPIWSTWAQYSKGVNQDDVMNYAAKIKQSGFSYSQIEIDDMYSTHYGDFDFDPKKFPDPKGMIESLHNDSFRVTIWIYPFANTDSKAFQEGMKYWVRGVDDRVPGLLPWWNGIAATIDTTNIEAAEWYRNRLKAFLDSYEIDGLKFDAGEVTYLPVGYHLHNMSNHSPDIYSTRFAEIAASLGSVMEVRVGHLTQHLPLFVRMLDRKSSWDENNGLRSVIPTTLTFGILGYPFVLPDMIGGNGVCANEDEESVLCANKPNGELFIRWVQANVFLPSMQFSIAPWDIDEVTVNTTRNIMQLREAFADYIVSCARQATVTGDPIIRPLWWLAPDDPVAQVIYTEFMLGDDYLVAPVLTPMAENQGKHRVYLPEGVWREQFGYKQVIRVAREGLWKEYSVTLTDLPFFALLGDFA